MGIMAQAIIRKAVPQVVQKAGVKAGVKPVVKQATGFEVMDINNIEFLASGRGGGKPMDPAVQRLIDKALTLEIGQGIKIPTSMRLQRTINGNNGATSVLHTYKGAQSLSKKSKANEMRFRTRRDVNENLWLFRVELLETAVPVEEVE